MGYLVLGGFFIEQDHHGKKVCTRCSNVRQESEIFRKSTKFRGIKTDIPREIEEENNIKLLRVTNIEEEICKNCYEDINMNEGASHQSLKTVLRDVDGKLNPRTKLSVDKIYNTTSEGLHCN